MDISRTTTGAVNAVWTLLGVLALACTGGPQQEPAGLQAHSLLDQPLFDRLATHGDSIALADSALRRQPDDVEVLLQAARARVLAWQYREAIQLYTRVIELDSTDWRPYRHRGHRYISTRRFADAIADLERARDLSPYSWDVAYHLGLAYFVAGRFEDAAREYGRCMDLADDPDDLDVQAVTALGEGFRSCLQNSTSPPSRVAMTDWYYRALRRAGRDDEASRLLQTVPTDWRLETNASYYAQLLVYRGILTEEDVLAMDSLGRFETRAYGIANWHLAQGDTTRALQLLDDIVRDSHWPGFGRIAAEADLMRLRE